MKSSIILALLLGGCTFGRDTSEPVTCLNMNDAEIVEGVRVKPAFGGYTYIEYIDRNGFKQDLSAKESKDWLCTKGTERANAAPVSVT